MKRALVLAVLALTSLAPVAPAQDAFEGCEPTANGQVCHWQFTTTDQPGRIVWGFDVPMDALSLATVTVVLDGADAGWQIFLEEEGDSPRLLGYAAHAPDGSTVQVHRVVTDFLVEADATQPHVLVLDRRGPGVGAGGIIVTDFVSGFSEGTFTVTYSFEALPPGEPPALPPATRSDPHLLAREMDARAGAYDLVAAWFDDRALHDGLLEAHLAVRDIADATWDEGGFGILYDLDFDVAGVRYSMAWEVRALQGIEDMADATTQCAFDRIDPLLGGVKLLQPLCTYDWTNGTLSARIPERALGSPGEGIPFERMEARATTRVYPAGIGYYNSFRDELEDRAAGERFPFALGGPEVWCAYNPNACVRAVTPAWYQAPLAKENVPDTLQVAGALLAGVTFVAGFVVVRRARRQTRELLERVDRLTQLYAADSRAGLRALGELEVEFSGLYRDGRINETQYQLAVQRLSAAATRLAFRHELGLDDGAPGVETHAPTRQDA